MEPGAVPFGPDAGQLIPLWHPSPNFGPRRDGARPDLIVLHYTAMDSAERACDWLCNPEAEVSAHYVICLKGRVWQLVQEDQRAWHAGAGQWGGVSDVNSRSIGIELSNTGSQPFAEPQMAVLETLLRGIMSRWSIPPERVIGHSDLAPGRKIDPGLRFDWARLARQGLAIRPDTAGLDTAAPEGNDPDSAVVDLDAMRKPLEAIGYTADLPLETRLAAFRLRFVGHRDGPPTRAELELARRIAGDYPVDLPSRFA